MALTGTLDLRFNGTTSVVNRVVTLGGTPVTIALPAAATTAGYLRFQGTGIVLTVAGQRLTGDVVVERSGTTTHARRHRREPRARRRPRLGHRRVAPT